MDEFETAFLGKEAREPLARDDRAPSIRWQLTIRVRGNFGSDNEWGDWSPITSM